MVEVAEKHCPAAISQAKEIERKYKKAFSLFAECHKIYDGNSVTDAEIDKLGKLSKHIHSYRHHIMCKNFRQEDQRIHEILQGVIPLGNCIAQDAYVRGTCATLAEEVACWVWLDG